MAWVGVTKLCGAFILCSEGVCCVVLCCMYVSMQVPVCKKSLWIQVEDAKKNAEEHAAALLREEQEKNQKAERRRAKNKKVWPTT